MATSQSLSRINTGMDNIINDHNTDETMTNFMRFGSIRPPIAVLQDEFLESYRLWKELYSEPLNGIDTSRENNEARSEYMTTILAIHDRYYRSGRSSNDGENIDLIAPSSSSTHHVEEKLTASEDGEENISAANSTSRDAIERNQLEELATVMFRKGARLFGIIQREENKLCSTYVSTCLQNIAYSSYTEVLIIFILPAHIFLLHILYNSYRS